MKKQNEDKTQDLERQGWKAEELAEESGNKGVGEMTEELCQTDSDDIKPEEPTGGCCGG